MGKISSYAAVVTPADADVVPVVQSGVTKKMALSVLKTYMTPIKVIAAGIYEVNDSPLAAAEFIPVTGILATDIIVCTLSVNGGSPQVYVLSAIASASPAGITVTASGVFTAGDKINYIVYRG